MVGYKSYLLHTLIAGLGLESVGLFRGSSYVNEKEHIYIRKIQVKGKELFTHVLS